MSKEALRYLQNAKELLSKSRIEDNRYKDIKYVKSACGVAYLGVLRAIDEYLIKKGVTEFEDIYAELHIAGYYRGLLRHTDTVKDTLKAAKSFIEIIK